MTPEKKKQFLLNLLQKPNTQTTQNLPLLRQVENVVEENLEKATNLFQHTLKWDEKSRCHKKDQSHRNCHLPKKSCEELFNEFIESAANIENALANAINAESHILDSGNLTSEELLFFTNKLEDLIKLSIKKELVLEFLIEDVIKGCKELKKHKRCTHSPCCKTCCCNDCDFCS